MHRDDLEAEEWWNIDDPVPHRLDSRALAEVLSAFEKHNVDGARSAARAMEEIDDYDPHDDPQPGFPNEKLVVLLGREVVETVVAEVAAEGPAPIAYRVGLRFDAANDYGISGSLIFLSAASIGVITVDASC